MIFLPLFSYKRLPEGGESCERKMGLFTGGLGPLGRMVSHTPQVVESPTHAFHFLSPSSFFLHRLMHSYFTSLEMPVHTPQITCIHSHRLLIYSFLCYTSLCIANTHIHTHLHIYLRKFTDHHHILLCNFSVLQI